MSKPEKLPWSIAVFYEDGRVITKPYEAYSGAFEKALGGEQFAKIPLEEAIELWKLSQRFPEVAHHASQTSYDLCREIDYLRSLLYRLVIKKDGTARQEAEALLKGDGK